MGALRGVYVCMCICVYTFVHEEYFLCGVVARACVFVEKSREVTEVEWSKFPEEIGWPRVWSASLSQEGIGDLHTLERGEAVGKVRATIDEWARGGREEVEKVPS